MTIEYNIEKDFKKIYNEVFEIINNKKQIKSNKKIKSNNFTKSNTKKIVIWLIITALISGTLKNYINTNEIINIIDILMLIVIYPYIYNQILFNKNLNNIKPSKTNKIIINKNKITDVSNDIEITIDINKITHIIIGKYSINVLIESNSFHLFFPIEIKSEFIKIVEKINKNIKIIELN